ncbi:Protein of uncharacterised function (DUF1064) [Serratia ficaria]|uniref:DUF1064 domain-containing protein n=1 Tax=Serratia ficaria TaxID=61651 RepID=UPI00217B9D94|nr:DUF1064 domain-containing protein [Serratia ficaria]CAI1246733.1 Protein of uncharacterised function (DUF1064) [Serratia ficaria]CAI2030357.1 Protein of uncharacterised function (DUF1064) [Serratia ficaria]CAI2528384.1 Protein of uncharacterised function (DUF1064) [Serratia ficaria]CAI2540247.1 Protein of uncharacterised function (DUF1064) [Serratia ficaria]CAI2794186.1 Protein of uncharacterised function (DUF1064) [Serratia ficaria]
MLNYKTLRQTPGKYGNKKTVVDGFTFDSKKEAAYYGQLKLRQRAGDIVMFLRQVPFHLPGGVKYVADFVVFRADGVVEVIDVKGVRTAEYRVKKKLVEHHYPITVIEV